MPAFIYSSDLSVVHPGQKIISAIWICPPGFIEVFLLPFPPWPEGSTVLGHSASHQQCSNMPLQLYMPGQVDKEPSPCSHLDNEKLSNGEDKEALEQVAWGTGGVSIESLRTG